MNDVKEQDCQVLEFTSGVILPQKKTPDGPMWGLGGVCDAEGHFVAESFYDGGWGKHGGFYEWAEENTIPEEAIYIGLFAQHWGHFLIDMSTRLWGILPLLQNGDALKVAYVGEEEPAGNNLRFFELLGVRSDQLYHVTRPTRFRKVYLPEQAFKSCEWYSKEHLMMLDHVVDQALMQVEKQSWMTEAKKIYFTRRSFSKAVSSEFGEGYFEKLFEYNGYRVVAPETLSLDEQIWIWNHAESIACINGSIPLNVLFCKNRELQLTILNKTTIKHENPYILLRMRGVQAEFLNVCKEPLKGYPKSLGEGPYLLWPTEELTTFCEKEHLNSPMNDAERKRFFRREKYRYYLFIIGIRRRMRRLVSKCIPASLKKAIRRNLRTN